MKTSLDRAILRVSASLVFVILVICRLADRPAIASKMSYSQRSLAMSTESAKRPSAFDINAKKDEPSTCRSVEGSSAISTVRKPRPLLLPRYVAAAIPFSKGTSADNLGSLD